MNTTIKPIIGRVGGKWRISRWVIEHIKRFDWSLYVEPFCGSAAIYFQLLNEGIPELIKSKNFHPRFVLNDMDSRIIDLYRCCRDFPELLAYAIYFTPYSREEHKLAQKGEVVDDLIEMCQMYLIRDSQSHSGYGERKNKDGLYNCPFATRMDTESHSSLVFNSIPSRILSTSHHLGEKFTELKQGIDQIEDETLREQSKQALDAILSEFQKSIETDIRVEFVRRFLAREYQGSFGSTQRQNMSGEYNSPWGMNLFTDKDQGGVGNHTTDFFEKIPIKISETSPHLQEISDLKKVYLENDDFEKVCRRWDQPHTLHYCDPPYFDKEDYYAEKFTKECHQRLCQMAHELEGQVIISYYPHPDILAMYSEDDWEHHFKESVASSCGVTRTSKTKTRPKRMELLLVRKRRNTDKAIIDLAGQLSLF